MRVGSHAWTENRQLKARGAEAVGPDEWVKKVITDYATFLSARIVPFARKLGMRIYISGVLPPVIEDCCARRPVSETYASKSSLTAYQFVFADLEAVADKYISVSPVLWSRTLYFDEADMVLATGRKIRRRSTFFPSSRLRILTTSRRAPP